MRPDPEDRTMEYSRPSGPPVGLIVAGVLGVALLGYWFFTRGGPEPVPMPPAPPLVVAPAPELPPAPDIPEPMPVPVPVAPPEPAPEAPVVPAQPPARLETSDAELRERLGAATDSQLLAKTMTADNLVERGTAAIDKLSRGGLLNKLLPVAPPKGKFSVLPSEGQLVIDPVNFQRYDRYAKMIEGLDTGTLVATFHRFRPLMEETYAGLGYRAEDFDNAVIRALDRILATPHIEGPIQVVKSEAIYKYADPSLEQQSELQKQLLRTGPENVVRVQSQAAALRAALLAGG